MTPKEVAMANLSKIKQQMESLPITPVTSADEEEYDRNNSKTVILLESAFAWAASVLPADMRDLCHEIVKIRHSRLWRQEKI